MVTPARDAPAIAKPTAAELGLPWVDAPSHNDLMSSDGLYVADFNYGMPNKRIARRKHALASANHHHALVDALREQTRLLQRAGSPYIGEYDERFQAMRDELVGEALALLASIDKESST
jgi:undecaprenyl pyrophosphate synthase